MTRAEKDGMRDYVKKCIIIDKFFKNIQIIGIIIDCFGDNDYSMLEEKAKELRQFSEIGVQRFFIQSKEKEEEELLELEKIIEETQSEIMEDQLWT
mgnify:CR=1 FL=1